MPRKPISQASGFNSVVQGLLILVLLFSGPVAALAEPPSAVKVASASADDALDMSVDKMISQAIVGTLYYEFDHWIPQFRQRITALEKKPDTAVNRLELMKFHFYLAGLLAELSHVLSFTSKFKVDSIRNDFDSNSKRAKELAEEILERENITKEQRAEAYFFLGASEGYVGIIEYGAGHILSALMNGLSADNHLEDALDIDPGYGDAYVGLGVYEYGNTRIGGVTNFLMQGGQDLRLQGLQRIEQALNRDILSRPLALKTLIWFYISEEINPDNESAESGSPLSRAVCRKRAWELLKEYESRYFSETAPKDFIGNKGLAMMKAIQFVLDRNYVEARNNFEKSLQISEFLTKTKGYQINPVLAKTVKEGIKFCDLMIASNQNTTADSSTVCPKIIRQIDFIENGGSMVEYESSKIRGEIQNVFHQRLKEMHSNRDC